MRSGPLCKDIDECLDRPCKVNAVGLLCLISFFSVILDKSFYIVYIISSSSSVMLGGIRLTKSGCIFVSLTYSLFLSGKSFGSVLPEPISQAAYCDSDTSAFSQVMMRL